MFSQKQKLSACLLATGSENLGDSLLVYGMVPPMNHKKKGEYSTIRHFEERDYILITFIVIYCSILSLVIVVNLLLYLIYKLNFTVYMYRKKYST